jgi:hypothetical protein
MCVRPIERPFGPTKGKNVIIHSCVGNSTPNRKFAYGSRVNSRSQSTPTRALSNRPQSRTIESLVYGLSKNAGLRRPFRVESAVLAAADDFRFAPINRHLPSRAACLKCAKRGHSLPMRTLIESVAVSDSMSRSGVLIGPRWRTH